MSTLTLNDAALHALRQRRTAGESVKAMAVEFGITWQKLDKAIRNGFSTRERRQSNHDTIPAEQSSQEAIEALLGQDVPTGPLTEKYRPRTLAALFGQERVAKVLRHFAANPYPTAFIFEGETGTGKTSAALALAEALGCDMTQKPQEFGGVYVVASGEQSADAVRDIARQMWNVPFCGSGWKVVIVNECDRMALPAETVWLDRLEAIPQRTVVVFTTNFSDKLSPRFRDRCTRLVFESDADKLEQSLCGMLSAVWMAETRDRAAPRELIAGVISQSVEDGKISFRRALQLLTPHVMSAKEGA
jgi:replication-associated recombination protein RarA